MSYTWFYAASYKKYTLLQNTYPLFLHTGSRQFPVLPNLDLVMPLPRQTACRANALQKKRPLDLDENSRMRKIKTVSLLKKFL